MSVNVIKNQLNEINGEKEINSNNQINHHRNTRRKRHESKKNEQGEVEYDYYYSDNEEKPNDQNPDNLINQQNYNKNTEENINETTTTKLELQQEVTNKITNQNGTDDNEKDANKIQNQQQMEENENEQENYDENENVKRFTEGTQTPKRNETSLPPNSSEKDENDNEISITNEQNDNENIDEEEHSNSSKNTEIEDNRTPQEKEIDEAILRCFNTFQAPPPEMREPIKQRLNARRVDAIIASKYDEAEEIDKYEKAFNYSLQLEADRNKEDNRIDILYGRYQNLQEKLQKEEEYWEQQANAFLEENDKYLEELKEKHKKELEEFSEKWRDPNYLRQFNKPSSKLLQLREMERARAVSRMYQQAKDIKIVADKLQQEETQRAQAKIARQMQIDKQKLLDRQKNDLVSNEQHKKKVLLDMKKEKEKTTKPIHAAISQMRAKKDTIPLTTKPRSAAFSAPQESITPISPRTHEKYLSFRTEKKKTRLDVHPVDEKTLKTPKSRGTTSKSTIRRPITSQRNKFGVRK